MPSSKGEPDNPQLREKVKEEVKALSKGGGPGSWSAWKAGELARRYEAKGGGYKDTGDNKNKAQPGAPVKKDGSGQKNKQKDEKKKEGESGSSGGGNSEENEKKDDEEKKDEGKGGGGSKAKGGKKK